MEKVAGERISNEKNESVMTPWDTLATAPNPDFSADTSEAEPITGEDLETVQQIESFLQENYSAYGERDGAKLAFRSAGEILGAKLGIKPASLTTIELITDGQDADTEAFEIMLQNLGMAVMPEDIGGVKRRYFYGKDTDTVKQAYDGFHKLWQTEVGTDERQQLDIRLGRLMGYPETAIIGDKNMTKTEERRLDRQYPDQLISHTPTHVAEEYAAYEQKIFNAIKEYCPNIYAANERQRQRTQGQKLLGLFTK